MSLRNTLAAAAALLVLAFAANAQKAPYATMNPPQSTEGGGKVEVIEFFWYGCPHCYHLEPALNNWLRNPPKDVVFKRVPAVIGAWEPLASVYYTMEAMGLLEKYHAKIFDAIHKDKQNLGNKNVREKWLAANGIDPAKYAEMEKSFSVVSKLQRAKQMTQAYKVEGVPRIVVNGKYYTGPEEAGDSGPQMIAAVDQMIALARKEKAALFAPMTPHLARR